VVATRVGGLATMLWSGVDIKKVDSVTRDTVFQLLPGEQARPSRDLYAEKLRFGCKRGLSWLDC
jgi:hypothetical protein